MLRGSLSRVSQLLNRRLALLGRAVDVPLHPSWLGAGVPGRLRPLWWRLRVGPSKCPAGGPTRPQAWSWRSWGKPPGGIIRLATTEFGPTINPVG